MKKSGKWKSWMPSHPAIWFWKPTRFAETVSAAAEAACAGVCPGAFLLSFLVLYFTKNHQDQLAVLMLRQPFMALQLPSIFAVIPLLLYWANCSGTSLVQRVYLSENRLCYTGYSGSMDQRVEFAFVLLRLENYSVGKRSIRIQGTFTGRQRTPTVRIRKVPFPRRSGFPAPFR